MKGELKKLYEEFFVTQFPKIYSENEELSDIFDELVLQDAHIAGLVSSYLQDAPIRIDWIQIDKNLNHKIEKFNPSNGDEEKTISGIREYNEKLNKMTKILKQLTEKNNL